MRKCPCCGALAFEDIDTCYECMHPLDTQPAIQSARDSSGGTATSLSPVGKHVRASGTAMLSVGSARELDSLGEVFCYSIDSSLEAPCDVSEEIHWSVELCQPGMPAKLTSLASSHPKVSIGRSRDNDLVIADLRVSRHHACIEFADDALWARDLESKNMTYLDGIPLLGTKRLGDGAELRIGTALLRVSRSPSPPATATVP